MIERSLNTVKTKEGKEFPVHWSDEAKEILGGINRRREYIQLLRLIEEEDSREGDCRQRRTTDQ